MPSIHEPEVTNAVEPLQFFYIGVKLTIPCYTQGALKQAAAKAYLQAIGEDED